MKRWYDGYLLDNIHIYNPNSVTSVLRKKQFRSFWAGTETYDALKIYIERNFDGLQEAIVEMLGWGTCPVDTASFQNDMTTFRSRDGVLTLLVHLGYLTCDKTYLCVLIPNLEVKEEFLRAIKNGTGLATNWDGSVGFGLSFGAPDRSRDFTPTAPDFESEVKNYFFKL